MKKSPRNAGGWPACHFDRRRPRPKVKPVTTPQYERMMRELRHLRDVVLPRLEFKVRVYELNDEHDGRAQA